MSLSVAIDHEMGDFRLSLAFEVGAMGITALFGPSGSGKTTTINAIAGLLRPRSGRIVVNGNVVLDTTKDIFIPPERRRLGYVFQDARLFPHMSVQDNLLFGARRSPAPDELGVFRELVGLLDLEALLSRYPARLSGGERQRVAIARAILSRPHLLLLDEPLASLDSARRNEVLPYLERLRDRGGIAMVHVSHQIDEVARLADNIVLLNRGRVAASGPVGEIMSRLDLFPLTGRFEAGAVIDARIMTHDQDDHLSHVRFEGGDLWLPLVDARVGETVRLRIRARDVILAMAEPEQISANNIVAGVVTEIRADQGAYVDVQIACGTALLLARITHRSVRRLGIAPGRHVYAVIKAINLDRPSTTRTRPVGHV